nr:ABC transporter substrate-binding protein [Micromonospora sp. DSM 115978]
MSFCRQSGRLAICVALVFASAGCATSSSVSSPGDCVSPGVTETDVKIGLVYPDSGGFAEIFSAARAGYDARFGLENANGGVHGRLIDYEWRDDEGVPLNNLEAVQDLVEREGVFAVAQASTGSSGGAEYLAANNIPVVGVAAEEVWIHFRNMFAFTYVFTDGESVDTFGRFVSQQGGSKALVIGIREREQAGGGLGGQLAASLQAAGVEVDPASPFEYTPGASSAQRFAQQLLDRGIDTLVTTGTAADFAEVVAAARDAGVPLKAM